MKLANYCLSEHFEYSDSPFQIALLMECTIISPTLKLAYMSKVKMISADIIQNDCKAGHLLHFLF